jgi:serine protease Do
MTTAAPSAVRHRAGWLMGCALALGLGLGLGLGNIGSALAQAPGAPEATSPALDAVQMRALERATRAVVGLRATAVEGARSARSLGPQREGSGIVIDGDLVLTIGYLILEAESVFLLPDDGRRVPARVVAYDLATGFGLVRALVPLRVEPASLASAPPAGIGTSEPLVIASGGEDGQISLARLLSRRAFSGYWEYHIEGALFTGPARRDHSGAGLFNARGELLGVGSLFVGDAAGTGGAATPGNMFVPVDLLRPILGELRERGSSSASTRAWLGISCAERDDGVLILRVNDDSPAEVAGLAPGDQILAIDGQAVTSLAVLWKALWAGGRPERPVTLDIRRRGQSQNQTVVVHTVDRAKTLRRPEGI